MAIFASCYFLEGLPRFLDYLPSGSEAYAFDLESLPFFSVLLLDFLDTLLTLLSLPAATSCSVNSGTTSAFFGVLFDLEDFLVTYDS
jgi:hypothetical protein